MAHSFYETSIVAAIHCLDSLDHIIDVAEQQPNASSLPSACLHEDMRPFSSQIHLAAQTIDRLLARLNKVEHVPVSDDLKTFDDMRTRIKTARRALQETDRDTINERGYEEAPTVLTTQMTVNMTGAAFAACASMPNLYFHLAIAYAILRAQGVPLGKWDYIQGFVNPVLAKGV